jgi:hypothetical protein
MAPDGGRDEAGSPWRMEVAASVLGSRVGGDRAAGSSVEHRGAWRW